MSRRLDSIAARQRHGRLRDLMFAAFVVLAGAIAVSSVGTAVASAQIAQR